MSDAAELQARQLLVAMHDRLARGPHEALGVHLSAQPADVRSAFLELTKTYHPVRFGRMSQDVQRLANEVFLGLRAAHDAIVRPRIPTQQVPRQGTQQLPRMTTQAVPVRGVTQQVPTTKPVPGAQPPMPRATSAGGGAPQRTSALTPAGGAPVTRPSGPAAPHPGPATMGRASERIPTVARTAEGSAGVAQTRSMPTAQPAGASSRGTGQPSAAAARPTPGAASPRVAAPDPELAGVLDLIAARQWDQARAQIYGLAAKAPASPRFEALLAFARGRQAQLEQRVDEARIELDRALQLDPDLQPAKSALGELFTRRR